MPAEFFFCPVTLKAIASVDEMRAHNDVIDCPVCGDMHGLDPEFVYDLPSSPWPYPSDDVNVCDYSADCDPNARSHPRNPGHHI
jgi:hypothetical protein